MATEPHHVKVALVLIWAFGVGLPREGREALCVPREVAVAVAGC